MNHFDELLLQYPSCKPAARAFILEQLLDLTPDLGTTAALELCWSEAVDPASPVAGVARFVLGQALPRRLAAEMALDEIPPGRAPGSLRALAGALDAVSRAAESPALAVRVAASLVLGRLRTRRGVRRLVANLAREPGNLTHAAALAESGDAAAQRALVDAIASHGAAHPGLLLAARALPPETAIPALTACEPRTDARGRASIAAALANQPPEAARPLLARLIERREGWTSAHALDTLAGWGEEADARVVVHVFATEAHELVRLHAIRAASVIGGEACRTLCLAAFRDGTPRVAAAALEALIRIESTLASGVRGQFLGDPRGGSSAELLALARGALASPSARIRAQACRIVCAVDPGAIDAPLNALLTGSSAERAEGIVLLGQLCHPVCAQLLARIARVDADATLRVEAARALARMPYAVASGPISDLLRDCVDVAVVRTLCRAMPQLDGRLGYFDVLTSAAVAASTAPAASPARAHLLFAIGAAAVGTTVRIPAALGPLSAALAGDELAALFGALEGLRLAGDALPLALVQPLMTHANVRVRARAAQACFLAGEVGALDTLAALASSSDHDEQLPGLEGLLHVGLMLSVAAPVGKLGRLLERLDPGGESQPDDDTATTTPHAVNEAARRRALAAERATGSVDYVPGTAGSAVVLLDTYAAREFDEPVPPAPLTLPEPSEPSRPVRVPVPSRAPAPPGPPASRPSPGAPSSRTPAPPTATPRVPPLAIAVGLAIAALIAVAVLPRAPHGTTAAAASASPRAAASGAFRVWTISGACRYLRPGWPDGEPVLGLTLGQGEGVATSATGRLVLRDRAGNAVTLGPSSRVTIAAPRGKDSAAVTLDAGEAQLATGSGAARTLAVGETATIP